MVSEWKSSNSAQHTIYLSNRFCFFCDTFGSCSRISCLNLFRLASRSVFDAGSSSMALVSPELVGPVTEASRCLSLDLRFLGTNFGMAIALLLNVHKIYRMSDIFCPVIEGGEAR